MEDVKRMLEGGQSPMDGHQPRSPEVRTTEPHTAPVVPTSGPVSRTPPGA
jgi:hypothetical protein